MRESSKSTNRRDAEKLLLKRNAAIEEGRTINLQLNRCKIDELFALVVTDYKVNGKRSLDDLERRIRLHLKPYFGGRRAAAVTADVILQFIEHRQRQKASNGEINRELAIIRRAFTLGRRARKVDDAPVFSTLREQNARTGFFEREQFEAIAKHLTPPVAAVARFAYITGWRTRSEVLTLQWRQIDFHGRTVRLEMNQTKNDDGRVFPFTSELEALLREQDAATRAVQVEQGRICPWVFHRKGKPIRAFYKQWRSACVAAGLGTYDKKTKRKHAERIPHDFRRTAVRNLVNASVPERVAMQMTGHKTRSVFDRYHVVSPGDVERAAGMLDARLTAERERLASGHNLGTVSKLPEASTR